MFTKLLIANRGEIACRIIRTARRMGIATAAVYSDADAGALHVELADEAVCIGPPPPAESYLRVDNIVTACERVGADAVHPGYGFLSENPALPEALEPLDIAFVGPPADAIRAMGDKLAAKRIAVQAGVDVIPGHPEPAADLRQAQSMANEIGYPVMLKAAAGGGGRGMRLATDDSHCADEYERAAREALASFADGRIFVEKFIERPRHIEIQVLADRHGRIVHLGERECSIQRRHQKVVEEAPSPFLDGATRESMGARATELARVVGYHSAGTVEFIVDPERNFYFLEMNTRLQVEHPVTEFITGLDLVELMLRVAAGEPLAIEQADVGRNGWSFEARIYAEDPERGFLPSSGRLVRFRPPPTGVAVRVDTGVVEGDEVSVFYDPLIAKLVTHGPDRATALERLNAALDGFVIDGVSHNARFLSSIGTHRRFREGRLSTAFIDEEFPDGFSPDDAPAFERDRTCMIGAVAHTVAENRRWTDTRPSLSNHLCREREWVVVDGATRRRVLVAPEEGCFRVRGELGSGEIITAWRPGERLLQAQLDGESITVQIEPQSPSRYVLWRGGWRTDLRVYTRRAAELHALMPVKGAPDLSRYLLSPMPGLLVQVAVRPGEAVKAGQPLAVVEAMKMENVLRAPRDANVAEILARPGDSLSVDQPIIEFE